MSQYVETATKTFVASGALTQFLRVKDNGSGKLMLADANDTNWIGSLERTTFADGDNVAVRLRTAQGTRKLVANAAISAFAFVYAGAAGKVAPSGNVVVGIAMEAATADNDVIEVLSVAEQDAGQAQSVTPDNAEGTVNTVLPHVTAVDVQANVNDANDFIVLPALSTVENGAEIVVVGNSGANFEVRTPAGSNEKINNVDADGTQEYLFTDTQVHKFVKVSNTAGWMAHGFTVLGAVVTAVVPD